MYPKPIIIQPISSKSFIDNQAQKFDLIILFNAISYIIYIYKPQTTDIGTINDIDYLYNYIQLYNINQIKLFSGHKFFFQNKIKYL